MYTCTSGFSIKVGSQKGISTAAHCYDYMTYEGATGIISFVGQATCESKDVCIDIQWHRMINGNVASATFRASSSEQSRTVTAAHNAVVHDYICNYGLATDQLCTFVAALSTCYNPEGVEYCGLARANENVTASGDSGGPWFEGHTAAGITSGQAAINGNAYSVFTPQTRYSENLNGSVLTQ